MTRDRYLAAIREVLQRIDAARDLSLAWEPGAVADAQRLAEMIEQGEPDIEAYFVLGWFHWYRHLAQHDSDDGEALTAAVRDVTQCFINEVRGLPEPLLPLVVQSAAGLATGLFQQARSSGNPAVTSFAVLAWDRIVASTPAEDPRRAGYLSALGNALRVRFEQTGTADDLNEAIRLLRQAVNATPVEQPNLATGQSNLASALQLRYQHFGTAEDLDEAITLIREAVKHTPAKDPNWAMYQANLGRALRLQFEQTNVPEDLDEAITVGWAAVQATPVHHSDHALYQSYLVTALRVRFTRFAKLEDLDDAITIGREVLRAGLLR